MNGEHAKQWLVIAPDCGMKYLPRAMVLSSMRWWRAAILRAPNSKPDAVN